MASGAGSSADGAAHGDDLEVVIAIPPTESLEEFLVYPQAGLILAQYLMASKQIKEDDLLMFWTSCREYKAESPSMTTDARREQAARLYAGFLKDGAPHQVKITNQVLVDLTEAQLFDPSADTFDSIANDVLDRMEKEIYPAFRASNTYKAVVKEDAPRLPFTPLKKFKTKEATVTRVSPVVTSVSSEELAPRGSQTSLDMEIKNSKRMLKKLERHVRKSGPPMSPEELAKAMQKATAS